MPIERLNYFKGEFLHAEDFQCEQKYHLDMRRRHNMSLHSPGIVFGLEVTAGTGQVTIAAGMAIDKNGKEIVLEQDQPVPITSTADLGIKFKEAEDPASDNTDTAFPGKKRIQETYEFTYTTDQDAVALAKVTPATPTVTLDLTVRKYSAPTAGGDLTVGGNIAVGVNRTVDGRDVSADGIKLDSLATDVAAKFNPATGHKHTGAVGDAPKVLHTNLDQVLLAAPSSTDSSAIKHVTDAQTKVWQDHALATGNPHNTSAVDVKALPLSGGTMTGSLTVNVVPTDQAALCLTGSGPGYGATLQLNDVASGGRKVALFSRAGMFTIGDNKGNYLNIDSKGYVGIGTTSPSAKLEVNGEMRVTGNFIEAAGGNERCYIGGDGAGNDVQIGSLRADVKNLVAWNPNYGTMTFICATLQQSSDLTMKTNITSLTGPLDKVCALRGVRFDWKSELKTQEKSQTQLGKNFGLIAQEVMEVVPEVVSQFRGKFSVSYTELIPLLIEAIKELQGKIDRLENQAAFSQKPITAPKPK